MTNKPFLLIFLALIGNGFCDTTIVSIKTLIFYCSLTRTDTIQDNVEIISDFEYFREQVDHYIDSLGIAIKDIKSGTVVFNCKSGKKHFIDTKLFATPIATIFFDGKNKPKHFLGMMTDIDLIMEMNKYFVKQ